MEPGGSGPHRGQRRHPSRRQPALHRRRVRAHRHGGTRAVARGPPRVGTDRRGVPGTVAAAVAPGGGVPVTARVLIADDQTIVRDGLTMVLRHLPGVEVVGAARDGAEAVALAAEHRPDVVLMDLRMPNVDGVEATRRIRAELPEVQVIVLTTYSDDESVFAALRAGARGYLTKDADADEIARAVAAVRGGASRLDPAVQRRLVEAVAAGEAPRRASGSGLPDGLTRREAEV